MHTHTHLFIVGTFRYTKLIDHDEKFTIACCQTSKTYIQIYIKKLTVNYIQHHRNSQLIAMKTENWKIQSQSQQDTTTSLAATYILDSRWTVCSEQMDFCRKVGTKDQIFNIRIFMEKSKWVQHPTTSCSKKCSPFYFTVVFTNADRFSQYLAHRTLT